MGYITEDCSHFVWNYHHPEDPIRLGDGYDIHHIDGDHYNDSPNNLQKLTHSDHSKLHGPRGLKIGWTRQKTEQEKEQIRERMLGNTYALGKSWSWSKESREEQSRNQMGRTSSDETRASMSLAHTGKPKSRVGVWKSTHTRFHSGEFDTCSRCQIALNEERNSS